MNNDKLYENLKQQLELLFPDHQYTGDGREFRINCPICQSEGVIDTGYHMYISVYPSDKPPMFNCFRNSYHRGILTEEFLTQFSQYPHYVDTETLSEISKFVSKTSYFNRFRLNSDKKYHLYTPFPTNDKRSLIKLNYINNRLGTNLSLLDTQRLKIVLNIGDLIRFNKIPNLTRSEFSVRGLDEYFVGFLSNNNASVRMRRLPDHLPKEYKSIDKRYMNYKTVSTETSNGYYMIPSQCDILKPIRINIAEGPFDILSVFLNVNGCNTQNNIYMAIGSNSYFSAMRFFLEEYGLIDIEFHIYIDNDIPREALPQIRYEFKKVLGYRVFIHSNMVEGEKDFGVPPNRINDYCYEL